MCWVRLSGVVPVRGTPWFCKCDPRKHLLAPGGKEATWYFLMATIVQLSLLATGQGPLWLYYQPLPLFQHSPYIVRQLPIDLSKSPFRFGFFEGRIFTGLWLIYLCISGVVSALETHPVNCVCSYTWIDEWTGRQIIWKFCWEKHLHVYFSEGKGTATKWWHKRSQHPSQEDSDCFACSFRSFYRTQESIARGPDAIAELWDWWGSWNQ